MAPQMIAFFDIETTVPLHSRGRYFLLEFGAIWVCPLRLIEMDNFSTLIRPSDLNTISSRSIGFNGITRELVSTAPFFADVADKVYSFLHGKIWAGHNILSFDWPHINKAFADIGRPSPEPIGTIDTLRLLIKTFGGRAENMKMSTLASYFNLGPQKHRSLDDVRLNLDILKCCATVLFLESNISNVSSVTNLVFENLNMDNCIQDANPPSVSLKLRSQHVQLKNLECSSQCVEDVEEVLRDFVHSDTYPENEDAFYLTPQTEQMNVDLDASAGGSSAQCSAIKADSTSYIDNFKNSGAYAGFLQPDEVVMNCITVSHENLCLTRRKMHVLHLNVPLWLCCGGLVIQYGSSSKFKYLSSTPKLSVLVSTPPNLCRVLSACDSLVRNTSMKNGSTSQWRPLLRKSAYANSSAISLHIPITTNSDMPVYSTDIYRIDDASESITKLVFSKLNPIELNSILVPDSTIDAFFNLETYDYHGNAGIRLVAKCLAVHSR